MGRIGYSEGTACENAVKLSGGVSIALAMMAVAHNLSGNTEQGDELLEKLFERSKQVYVAPSSFAEIHLSRGERNTALDYLKRAVQARDSWLIQ